MATFRAMHPELCRREDALPSNANGSRRCFPAVALFEWIPSSGPMRVPRVTARNFCEGMRRVDARRLRFVGDSVMQSMAVSLWSLLGLKSFSMHAKSGTQTLRCKNDRMVDIELRWISGEDDFPGLLDALSNVSDPSTVTILNFGAHFPRTYRDLTVPAFFQRLGQLQETIRHLPAPHRVVWRSSPMGAPGCEYPPFEPARPGLGSGDWARRCATGLLDDNTSAGPCPFREAFGWQMFGMFNQAARDALEPLGLAYLDVTSMSEQWSGAHTAFRHGNGKLPPDCLHFTLPGVPDTWNAMLVGGLLHCMPGALRSSGSGRPAGAPDLLERIRGALSAASALLTQSGSAAARSM